MNSYPRYHGHEIIDLCGLWSFAFFEGTKLEELETPCEIACHDRMCVPGSFDTTPSYYSKRGVAVYAREFELREDCLRGVLRIGGLGLRAKFWIDGEPVGGDELPYSAMDLPLGGLRAGRHTIRAAVDNCFDAEKMKLFLPYYDFFAFGGFYRGLELHAFTTPFHLDRIKVHTCDFRSGLVELSFRFAGEAPKEFSGRLRFDTETEFHDFSTGNGLMFRVPEFKPWSPEHPALHTVEVVYAGESVVERFGIREIRAGNREILLNGEPISLRGFNRHESHPLFGPATPEQLMLHDIQHLKALNCNCVRGCHYAQDPRFLDLCDETGMLCWEESLGWGNTAGQMADPGFCRLQEEQTRLMVRNSINHPCVIIRGFLNECHSESREGLELCRKLIAAIRNEDGNSLVTFACNHNEDDICNDLTDMIAFNAYPGWIDESYDDPDMNGIGGRLEHIIRHYRSRFGEEKPLIISEIGCCAIRGERDDAGAQWTEEFQAEYLSNVLSAMLSADGLSGILLWQLNDTRSYHRHGANLRTKPLAQNLAGVFDSHRRPKVAAETVRKLFLERQMNENKTGE